MSRSLWYESSSAPSFPMPMTKNDDSRPVAPSIGSAEAATHLPAREGQGVGQQDLRERGKLDHPLLDGKDPAHVVDADPQRLEVLEAPQRVELRLEAVARLRGPPRAASAARTSS